MNLDLMRLIDKQFLETPFYGVRQMTWHLRNEDHLVNEKRIRRLMGVVAWIVARLLLMRPVSFGMQ
ncbi:IS3 family transposase [Sulfitobacter brevis]|jgi:putative transposase|nr:IS3 family transposase [Sulfitobacter brevis]